VEHIHPLPIRPLHHSHWKRWTALGLLTALVVAGCAAWLAARRMEPWLRARIVDELGQRFQARVELDGFHIWLAKGVWAEGNGLRIWPPAGTNGQAAAQPMIRLEKFRFHAPLVYKPGKPLHISKVELEGLTIEMPPKEAFAEVRAKQQPRPPSMFASYLHFQVDAMECKGAMLTLETSKPGKLPLTIPIAFLRLMRVQENGTMGFEAQLTNPRPAGQIRTAGNLGPWQTADPGETPVAGKFRLEHADLSTIHGIRGRLDGVGEYQGTLRDLTVVGETRVPNFSLERFGAEVPLVARYHATVDGTNGDTHLNPVEMTLGSSHLRAQGDVVRVMENGGSIGRSIHLEVHVDRGRIEDFLRLTSRSGLPLLTGTVEIHNTFDLQPGQDSIHDRIRLQGKFVLADALFTSPKIQSKVDELSARGLGNGKAVDAQTRSEMASSFTMNAGTVNLPDLLYAVPGATIQLKGNYGVEGGTLDFAGSARLQAPVSKIVGGWQGTLLKPLDGIFRKDGAGTVMPIHLKGTREDPEFGVNVGPFHFDSSHHASHKP